MSNNAIVAAMQQIASKMSKDKLPNEPWAEQAYNALMSGDANAGNQLATNLCQSNGFKSQEDCISQFMKKQF